MLPLILISIATFTATMLGGLVALKLRDKLHLILGFSAGAVIAVALFDLLPESIQLGSGFYSVSTITSMVACGFMVYLILDRWILLHGHDDGEMGEKKEEGERGKFGAGTLSIHSLLDGVAVGLAFQVSTAVGVIVAIAVLVHDFSDGINTVSLVLKGDGERKTAFRWLLVDAIAPVVGICSTFFFSLSGSALAIILSIFSGFFLYIGASDLIPESHHAHPKSMTTFMTVLGALVLFAAIRLVNL